MDYGLKIRVSVVQFRPWAPLFPLIILTFTTVTACVGFLTILS
jgi:hypothetical protein